MPEDTNFWSRAMRRRFSRRTILRSSAAGAGIVGLAAVGCGSSKNNNSSKASSGAAATSAAVKATAAPSSAAAVASAAPSAAAAAKATGLPQADASLKTGGTINLAIVVAPPLDPYENSTYSAQDAVGYVYSRLFRFQSGTDPQITLSRTPVGELVESFELADPTTYTMHLRQGVMWHPPLSRPLTSADVMDSYKRFTTDSKNTNAKVFDPIVDSLTAPDDKTLVFKLKMPYAPFLNKLANPQYLWIMSSDAVSGKIDPSQQVVGTGPWIFVSKTPTALTYKKNPDYFIKGIPYADQVVRNVIPTTATQEAEYQAGKLDVLGIPAQDVDAVKKQVPNSNVVSYIGNLLAALFFTDVSDPTSPFNDVRMRQAASYALDRNGLLDLVYSSKGGWDNLINPGLGKWWLDPQGKQISPDAAKLFKHDPAQAKQLIQQAGHADTTFKFIYPNNAYGDVYNSASDAIRGMLSDAGFKVQVLTVDYLKDYINNGQGIFFHGAPANSIVHFLETPFTDPDDYLVNLFTKSGRNHENVDDPDLTALIKQEQAATDDAKRLQLVYQAQQMQDLKMYYPPTVNGFGYVFFQSWVKNPFIADDYAAGTEATAYLSINKG